jgi:outer membrane immunogenic protein
MKKLLIAGVALTTLVAGPAMAADMAVKSPVYKAPPSDPIYNWSGFYAGGNIGYSWGRADSDLNVPGLTVIGGLGFLPPIPTPINIPGAAFSDSNNLKGFIGGGQIGYNAQTGNLVLGLEADWQISGEKGGAAHTTAFDVTAPVILGLFSTEAIGTVTTQVEAKIAWFGTVRGRIGYATNGLLLYGTGGLAYGRVQVSGTSTINGGVADCFFVCGASTPFSSTTAFAVSRTNVGWALGAGVEGALAGAGNWTWKAEYLYVDLGSLDAAAGTAGSLHTRFADNIVRLGLNFRFGGPLVARY